MATRREWLVSKGLAKASRGKLSQAAHEAINKAISEGMVFSDVTGSSANTVANARSTISGSGTDKFSDESGPPVARGKVVAQSIPDLPVTHQQSTVWGVDDNGRSALVIAFDSCASCGRAIKYCLHAVPKLPAFIGGGDALMEKPNVTQP